ncbi:unnamed protein product [Rhizophagus irregularis]|uniref:Methyltransferase domain-containing protein n=1 Tax=Rhizophagus irregularis TaxID=588596 RepID=A0A2I1H7G7_9GLOM|nr:hypothetical protein RhiirA4_410080 [Rhizophagus irregularis]CAB4425692.1 unnamed protein product [Rhizophagus irregularis]
MGCVCVKPKEEEYRFPIPDDVDIPFSQMLHYVHRFIWQGNFSSPVEERLKSSSSRARVLNVKCGEGAWLKDNAKLYQTADFFGCDITATLQYDVSPSFLKADILDGLRYYDKNTFDFIYLQFGLYTENEWRDKVIKELVRLCKPGGWIEILDCENQFYNERDTTSRLGQAYRLYLDSKQINPLVSSLFEEFLSNTNQIIKIHKEEKECILGVKGGRVGKYLLQNIVTTWKNSKVLISESMGITQDQYDKLIQQFINEINKSKTSIKFVRVYGQKNDR